MIEPQHPQFSRSGQVALIKGAGIGFATATLLAELDCQVALCATGPRINECALGLTSKGHVARSFMADLNDPSSAHSRTGRAAACFASGVEAVAAVSDLRSRRKPSSWRRWHCPPKGIVFEF